MLRHQAIRIEAQIACAIRELDSVHEDVRGAGVRALCPGRTHQRWTLEPYGVPRLHDASPLVRYVAHFVLSEELDLDMVREARAADARGNCRTSSRRRSD